MRLELFAFLVISFASSALAVYADEAYQVDYHQAYLGVPGQWTTFFHRPTSASRGSLLYSLSERLIVGAINPRNGSVVWRQSVQSAGSNARQNGYLRAAGDILITAVGEEVRAWDASDGRLAWASGFKGDSAAYLEALESAEGAGENRSKDALALFSRERGGVLRRLNGGTGDVVWEFADQSGDTPIYVSTSTSAVYYISLHPAGKTSFKTRVTTLDPATGKQSGQYTLSTESDVVGAASILNAGANSASPIIAWTEKASKTLKVNVLGSKHVSSFNIPNESGDEITKVNVHAPDHAQSLCHFLVHFETAKAHWADVYHIDVSKSAVNHAYSLPRVAGRGSFSMSTQDANVYFIRHAASETLLVSSASHGILKRWPRSDHVVSDSHENSDDAEAQHAASEVVARAESTFSVRSALTLSSGDWILVRNGELDWRRTEALSGAVAAEWIELKDGEDLARELEVEGHGNVLAAYIHRVNRHAKDSQRFPAWAQALPMRVLGSVAGGDSKVAQSAAPQKDGFGFRKLVAVATESGRLYALDAGNRGDVVWSTKVADLQPGEKWNVRGILADPNEDTITVKGASGDSVVVQAATGKLLQRHSSQSDRAIETAIPVEQEPGTQDFLEIHESGVLEDLPVAALPKGDPILVVRSPDGTLRGMKYFAAGQASKVKPTVMWEFSPPSGSSIRGFSGRPSHDPVASIGRVLGDRSVMYKYLNPNLLLVTSVDAPKSTASFHLLDGVAGTTLYSATHEGADVSRHISSTISENWFVYSFWGQLDGQSAPSPGTRGFQLVTAEIYESEVPNDRGPLGASANFSSLMGSGADSASVRPYVVSQSFLISQEISSFAVTQTRQGITSRNLLATLASSNAIVAIPRAFIDPRRPVGRDPTRSEMEEGLGKYVPTIEFDPKWIITHKQEVMGVKKIITTPALLESTSLVFAYGLDIFGTRAAPSMTFDILGKGFAKIQLLLTVFALGVGVMFLAPTVARKQINTRWQVS